MNLIHADLLKWLRDNQWLVQNGYIPKAHAIMGDPPYFLSSIVKRFGGANAAPAKNGKDGSFKRLSTGFMNTSWDGFDSVWAYQAWATEWGSLLLDYVYPGGVLAMFGGQRTYHRLAAGLEDAGWEVFDCLIYCFGSGFPKAADIGKMIDKSAGAERDVVGLNPNHREISGVNYEGIYAGGNTGSANLTAPATPDGLRWDGFKNALKPGYEPIILARAPRGKHTFAQLATQYGSGALNIDAARIPYDGNVDPRTFKGTWKTDKAARNVYDGGWGGEKGQGVSPIGRYPANLVLGCACATEQHDEDCPVRLLDEQSGERKAGGNLTGREPSAKTAGIYGGGFDRDHQWTSYDDDGGASRFFYTAKSPKWEREAGLDDFQRQLVGDGRETPIDNAYQRGKTERKNSHPTLKAIQLTTWLAKLLLPPVLDQPRRILVPFAGTGSEMIGAHLAGWDEIVGIEREDEYATLNRARTVWWAQFDSYEQARSVWEGEQVDITQEENGQLNLF